MVKKHANFPRNFNAITPAWLNSVQQQYVVSDLQIRPISNPGLTADVAVITLDTGVDENPTLVAKASSQSRATRAQFANYYAREVLFYREIAGVSNLRVPHCYFAECDGDDHLILLEDMAPSTAGDTVSGVTREFALDFSRLIAGLHATWWENKELESIKSKLPEFGKTFASGYSLALRENGELLAEFSGNSTSKLAKTLVIDLQQLWESQWLEPQTIVQWDSHASNVVHPTNNGGEWCVIDWQNSVVGSGPWDIARFCVLSLPTEVRRSCEKEIVTEYADALALRGVAISAESVWASYLRYLPLMFAQQFRFISSDKNPTNSTNAWKEAIMPRVVAALHDAY